MLADDDRGSSPVEFVLVGALLTMLTLGILQLGLAIYVRNVAHDAAVTGAQLGALADADAGDGVQRTRDLIDRTIGREYSTDVRARVVGPLNSREMEVTVRTPLPLFGLLGIPDAWEVSARAPLETLE